MSIIENADKIAETQASSDKSTQIKTDNLSEQGLSMTGMRDFQNNLTVDKPVLNPNSTSEAIFIDSKRLTEMGFICADNAKSALAEQFRMIKRPLLHNAFGLGSEGIDRSNLILICSSLPGEGKTFVSINLALSIANERNKNVLLIDADVENPSICKTLGFQAAPVPGLIEYLENPEITFADIVKKTNLPNLNLIPAGKRHRFSTELLASQRMYQFAEEVSRRYKDRIVIFDSPPLMVATQAPILAQLVGQVVFVVAADSTLQAVITEALAKLKNCDVVLTLLNKSPKTLGSYGYGYGTYGH